MKIKKTGEKDMKINADKCRDLISEEYCAMRNVAKNLLCEIIEFANKTNSDTLGRYSLIKILVGKSGGVRNIPFKRLTALAELLHNGFIELD